MNQFNQAQNQNQRSNQDEFESPQKIRYASKNAPQMSINLSSASNIDVTNAQDKQVFHKDSSNHLNIDSNQVQNHPDSQKKMMQDFENIDVNDINVNINDRAGNFRQQVGELNQKNTYRESNIGVRNSSLEVQGNSQNFEKHTCFGDTCITIRRFFNYIGATLSLLSTSLDIAYVAKSPFYSSMVLGLSAFFIALKLFVTVGISQFYYTKFVRNYKFGGMSNNEVRVNDENDHGETDETGNSGGSEKQQEIQKQGQHLYSSMHVFYYTGFFRLLESKDFAKELGTGYLMDLLLTIFPMIFCEAVNNNQSQEDLTALQKATMIIKVFSLLIFTVEVSLMIFEVCHNFKMRKLQIQGYEKISEIERRRKNSKKMSIIAFVSMVTFVISLILALAISQSRSCIDQYSLQLGVCQPFQPCTDPLCLSCSDDPNVCNSCPKPYFPQQGTCQKCADQLLCKDCGQNPNICLSCQTGYFPNQNGQCQTCNQQNPAIQSCQKCQLSSDRLKTVCNQCSPGFRNQNGTCIDCNDKSQNCMSCTTQGCNQCNPGYFLQQDGSCQACNKTLNYCTQCQNSQQCQRCNTNIAQLDINNKCTLCNTLNGWQTSSNRSCLCQNILNFNQNYSCQTCSNVIRGCGTCQFASFFNPTNASAFIGSDPAFQTQRGSYAVCQAPLPGFYPTLKSIVDPRSQNVTIQNVLQTCGELINGCISCNQNGSSCLSCDSGYYLNQQGNKNVCGTCSDSNVFGGCLQCNKDRGCTQCQNGFFKFIYKCYKSFW